MRFESTVNIVKTWITCGKCDTRFKADMISNVPIDQYVAFMKTMRCVSCGAGYKHLAMGGGMDLAKDKTFRNVAPDAGLRERFHDWKEWGDVGLSSATLVHAVTGWCATDRLSKDTPADPSDLRRVLLAMDRMPEVRADLSKASAISPAWTIFVERFPEIEAAFLEEAGPGMDWQGKATKTFDLLQEVEDAGRRAATPPVDASAQHERKEDGDVAHDD